NVCKTGPEWFVPQIRGPRFRAGYDQTIEVNVTKSGDLIIRPFQIRTSPICPRNLWQGKQAQMYRSSFCGRVDQFDELLLGLLQSRVGHIIEQSNGNQLVRRLVVAKAVISPLKTRALQGKIPKCSSVDHNGHELPQSL